MTSADLRRRVESPPSHPAGRVSQEEGGALLKRTAIKWDNPPVGPGVLPEYARLLINQLAVHEAGHALVAFVLGFGVEGLSMTLADVRLTDVPRQTGITWWPEGDAQIPECGAVSPTTDTTERCRQAAMVALAGAEARRLLHPDAGDRWNRHEEIDRGLALQHIGFDFPDPVKAFLDPKIKEKATKAAVEALVPIGKSVRQVLKESLNEKALRALAEHFIARGSVTEELTDEGTALLFSSTMKGAEARQVISDAGVHLPSAAV